MPIKQTKPRSGSTPMIYFEGNARGFSHLKLRRRFGGIRLTAPFKVRSEILAAMKKRKSEQVTLAKIEKKGEATHIAIRAVRIGRRYLVSQAPARHGVTSGGFWKGYIPSFLGLKTILKDGFRPNHPVLIENVEIQAARGISRFAKQSFSSAALKKEERIVTRGDSYTIYLNPIIKPTTKQDGIQYGVAVAKNNQLLGITIKLQRGISRKKRKIKIEFYRRYIQKQFGIPVKFVTRQKR